MKKRTYIVSTLALLIGLASCQKTEFEDIVVPASSNSEESKIIPEITNVSTDQSVYSTGDEVVLENPYVSGMVKEVSDGDEESDDDENISSN